MKISDVTCPSCQSLYELAESTSTRGSPDQMKCAVCGKFLAAWQEPKLRACRLVLPLIHKSASGLVATASR